MPKLSIVIPVYFNELNLESLYCELKNKIADKIDCQYEIIFVDDGSHDGSWNKLEELSLRDSNVKIFRLSRNFGSHAAILCGLTKCTGDCAVIKAADLQEPTELILDMYQSWLRGNNVVLAVRKDREEGKAQKSFAKFYYRIVRRFALSNMPKTGFDVFLVDRKVIEVLERMDERNSAITLQILWSGFKTDLVYYTRAARKVGKSRWTLKKKLKLVSDSLFSFSTVPITFISIIGAVSFTGSIIWALIIFFFKIFGKIPISGWTTLIIINLTSFGILMLTLGLLGSYLWRTFDASRKRPTYIVERSNTQEDAR